MKILYIFLFFLFLGSIRVSSQTEKQFKFELDGTINADTGKVHLYFYTEYTSNKLTELVAQVTDNKFSFSGFITEPQGVFIIFDNRYMSSNFIIDKGLQTIAINTNLPSKVPDIKNKMMVNEYPYYEVFFKSITTKREMFYNKSDSLETVYNRNIPKEIKLNLKSEFDNLNKEENNLLLRYCVKNPNSYFAFWKLIKIMQWGYEPIYDSIYIAFSEQLKNGYAGTALKNKLMEGRVLTVGKNFPLIPCADKKNKPLELDLFKVNTFTLVDFWYSKCGPCRAQFNKLKDLYSQFNTKGFEIVAISTDSETNKKSWEDLIITEKLLWKQYLDVNGNETKKLAIFAFPTNFLIDNSGKIVGKNISLEELSQLLNKNLGSTKAIK